MAIANTVSLSTNLNVDPYYDDFDETKNFHRILFRPGFGVQARELTQIQSILQNQIDRFGQHVFKEGSVVTGIESFYNRHADYVKIRDNSSNGSLVTVSNLLGQTFTATNGVTANVYHVVTGSEITANTKTLYVSYTSRANTDNLTKTFSNNQVLTSTDGSLSANVISASGSTGIGSVVRLGGGVIYAKDHFIRVEPQTVEVGRYSANTSALVGYLINESIVTSENDSTLLDPASGSFNFAAPGANRLKLEATLVRRDADANTEPNFVEVLRIKNGNVEQKSDIPIYSQIDNYLARRTYAINGHLISEGLNLKLREHLKQANNGGVFTSAQSGNSSLFSVDVKPGKAFVFGYERDNLLTKHVAINKGIDFVDINAGSVTSNYGNYVTVNDLSGIWDYNNHAQVSLRDNFQNAMSNNSIASAVVGTEIGKARVRAIEHSTGTPGAADATYKVYLYDIKMSGGPFSSVRSIYSDGTNSDGKADIVLTSNNAVLDEQNFNFGIFEMPATAIRQLRDSSGAIDTSYQFLKKFSVTIATDGTFTLNTGNANERYQDTGLQSATQKRNNFHVVIEQTANTPSVATGTVTSGSNTVASVTSASTKFNKGDRIQFGAFANTFVVSAVGSTSLSLFATPNFNASANVIFKVFAAGSVIDMGGVGSGGARTLNVTTATSAAFDIQETFASGVTASVLVELNRVSAREKAKTLNSNRYVQINTTNAVSTTTGPWTLGLADVFKLKEVRKKASAFASLTEGTVVTDDFFIDNGQRDNIYNLSALKKKQNSTLTISSGDHLLIKVDHFTEDTSQGSGYFSVDSYPIDNTNSANTLAITTAEIPVYTSPITGVEFALRDSIDIRTRVTNTANNVTSLTNISINPANTHTTIVEGTGNGLRFPAPNENFTIDFSFFLPRVDKIVIDKEGNFRDVRGVSSINPTIPPTPADAFELGSVFISPFPSVIAPQDYIPGANTANFSYIIENRVTKYTSQRLQTLEDRVRSLEYYTSLNLLEKSAEALNVTDGNGLNRFKSGILVDGFLDRTIGDVSNADFKALIDVINRELTPRRYDAFTKLEFNASTSSGITRSSGDVRVTTTTTGAFRASETVSAGGGSGTLRYQVGTRLYIENVTGTFPSSGTITGGTSGASATISSTLAFSDGKLVTLPYSHDLIIESDYSSDTRNAAGIAYTHEGFVTLTPDTDVWVDTVNLPPDRTSIDITRGTRTETTGNGFLRRNVASRIDILSQTSSVTTNRDTNIIPFIRAQNVNFRGRGMISNARVFPFFDGVDVSSFCVPTTSSFVASGNVGDALITSANGEVHGTFQLPNDGNQRFETGTLTFRLIDNLNNNRSLGNFTTVAEGQFTASGTQEIVQDSVITVRELQRVNQVVLFDPLAQTFRVEDSFAENSTVDNQYSIRQNPSRSPGMFLTKLDLFFASKDPTLPIEIQIREVDPSSGFVTSNVIPFSSVIVEPDDINVNATSPVPTPIYFNTPIYLLTDVDYAIVVKPAGGSPRYNLWVARMGETDIITGNRITANPYSGLLFVSANDRNWTSIQEEDLTFRAYFANFGENKSGSVQIENPEQEYFTISNTTIGLTTGQTVHGETSLVFTSQPSVNVGTFASGGTSLANGIIASISSNTASVKDVTLPKKYTTGETVTFFHANGLTTGVTAVIHSNTTPTGVIQFIDPNAPENGRMTLESITGTFSANTQFKEQVNGYTGDIDTVTNLKVDEAYLQISRLNLQQTRTEYTGKLATSTTSRDSAFSEFSDNGETFLEARKFILGDDQETSGLSGAKSADFKLNLTNSNNNRHSPAVDIDRMGLIATEFFINNDETNENQTSGGNATARYISKTVTLEEGLDAEDLRVLVTAYLPSVSSLAVYGKFLNSADDSTMDDRPFQELSRTTVSTVVSSDEDKEDYKEIEFNLPTSVLTGASNEYQYTTDGVTYTGYKSFKLKLVLMTSNEAKSPVVRDYRAIALQK